MASGFYCRWSPIRFSVCLTCGLLGLSGKFPKRFCMVGTRYFESTEKVKPTFRLKVNNGE